MVAKFAHMLSGCPGMDNVRAPAIGEDDALLFNLFIALDLKIFIYWLFIIAQYGHRNKA